MKQILDYKLYKLFDAIRQWIIEHCESSSPLSSGKIELDENYLGARRVREKKGREAAGKIPVLKYT